MIKKFFKKYFEKIFEKIFDKGLEYFLILTPYSAFLEKTCITINAGSISAIIIAIIVILYILLIGFGLYNVFKSISKIQK